MKNIKQQIEELRKQLKESYKENRKQIWKLEEVLQQQVNKPKIEVGKVYKDELDSIIMITSIESDQLKGFGIVDESWYDCRNTDSYYGWASDTKMIESTKEEWQTALTKHADKLYEGVEKVDRSGMNLEFSMGDVVELLRLGTTSAFINESGEFEYNGYIVMNSKGVWAKPCDKIDYDVEFLHDRILSRKSDIENGKYKLVKVG